MTKLPEWVYVLAASPGAACKLAGMIATGTVPSLYADEAACLAAWRRQCEGMLDRYQPYAITFCRTLTSFYRVASKRLDTSGSDPT